MVLYIAPSRSILLLPMSMSVTSRKKEFRYHQSVFSGASV